MIYAFLLAQAKAVCSAAVRLGTIGPYRAQQILAAKALQSLLADCVDECAEIEDPRETYQTWPLLDVFQGRHELLYSRVFNA